MSSKPRICKECEPRKKPLDAPYEGPRCYRHHKARQVHVKAQARQRYVSSTYNLPPGFVEALFEMQGGRCYWCQLAMGKSRNLPIDHDHKCCPGKVSCGKCVRGLLCHECNQFIGRRMRDNPDTIRRGAQYLHDPPAQRLWLSWTPTT
jgi:hypothetical protein